MTAVFVVFAAPAPAMAADNWHRMCGYEFASCQTGVKAGLVDADQCMTASGGLYGHSTQVCVKYDGDYVYVRDGQADGHSAIGVIESDNGNVIKRHCRNPYGSGTWAKCNFNWSESGYKWVGGGYLANFDSMPREWLWKFTNN
ncbi:hypothetical protein [Micromonospora zhanjiangensis]|uniref:Peptidase inhibitor family I36 n=1 Tax=Micromonospora zhanjiangensis TaxID=1522057 RepID=A0ABV8KFB8_9ACTN